MVADEELKKLETQVGTLLGVLTRLKQENQVLRANHTNLTQEHARLAEKNRLARARIESIIGRLKSLERR